MSAPAAHACETCTARNRGSLEKLGIATGRADYVIALAGNPNTGKSTVFNTLTGLRQHTGNWPGKTISRAEGAFTYGDSRFKIVDLPGTYSLLSSSPDEEVARDFILFGKPDVTVVVVDGCALERNLNLALQILQITDRAIVCLNLMDEARARGLDIDCRGLARELGVPVVPTAARHGEGIDNLLAEIDAMAKGTVETLPRRLDYDIAELGEAIGAVEKSLTTFYPHLPHRNWIALRLLQGDPHIAEAVHSGSIGQIIRNKTDDEPVPPGHAYGEAIGAPVVQLAETLRWRVAPDFHERWLESVYGEAACIAERHVVRSGAGHRMTWERRLDWLLTSKWTGFPMMILVLAGALWVTILGANYPSKLIAELLIDKGHPFLREIGAALHFPAWLSGVLFDGIYLTTAWVISVMLPPMAIFFPIFTILEDFGYLPRVAFNLDRLFQKVGAHGKQALTMCMGLGCNAAGVVATRIIDSPRERLIAIITNNFALCNGRWPTQILIAAVFIGALVPGAGAGIAAAGTVTIVALTGVALTFASSWVLTKTLLKGEASTFSLELPPYRPPHILRTLYTSLIDRTIFVLWRAVVFALPAGAVIWLISNIPFGDASLAMALIRWLDPAAWYLGLTGVILVAYIVAIPANEIVIPTILMLTVLATGLSGVGEQGAGVMFETSGGAVRQILEAGGWSTMTAICLMIFSLCHNPCSTTIYTIYKETGSVKWTTVASIFPIIVGVVLCAAVATVWRLLAPGL